jgi:hypothetical protein
MPSRLIDKFQGNELTEPYEVTAKLGKPRSLPGRSGVQRLVILMTVVESRAKIQREPRRQLHKRLAWITLEDGVTEHECHVLDLSSGGARIAMDDAMDVRDRFELTLVRGHHKRELCEVVWRRGKTYGVKFVTPLPDVTEPATDPTAASVLPS